MKIEDMKDHWQVSINGYEWQSWENIKKIYTKFPVLYVWDKDSGTITTLGIYSDDKYLFIYEKGNDD